MDFNIEATRVVKEVLGLKALLPYDKDVILIMGYAGGFVFLFFGYLLSIWIGGVKRSFFAVATGLLLPWIVGLFAYAVLSININQILSDETLYLPISLLFGLVVGVCVLVSITSMLLGVDFIRTIIIFMGAIIVAGVCAYFSSEVVAVLNYVNDAIFLGR